MVHPMSEPWLLWEPIATFPEDGEDYLADDDRVAGGFPQVVYFDNETGRLHVNDCGISYVKEFFTRWARIPL